MGRRAGSKNRRTTTIDFGSDRGKDFMQATAFPDATEVPSSASSIASDAKTKKTIAEAVAEVPQIFTASQVAFLFDVYAAAISFIYSVALKVEYAAISDELSFDEDQKITLAEPLARILSKYCPSEWAGKSAEIELITGMGLWTVTSFGRAKSVALKLSEEKKRKNQTHPVEPMRRGEVLTPA